MWGKHPLPTVRSWKEARRFVCSIMGSSNALDALQAECVNWWAAKQGEWTESIRLFIQKLERMQGPTRVDDFVSRSHRVPGWQFIELLRHNNLPAMKRRLFLQGGRLLSRKLL